VLTALRDACGEVHAVRGNNDVTAKWPVADHAVLGALSTQLRIELPGGALVVEHGDRFPPSKRHARLRTAHTVARAVLYGHSHKQLVDEEMLPWILNAGAAGRARTHGGPSCLVLSATPQRWRVEAHRFP
jgi:predicted phosphodiesterase